MSKYFLNIDEEGKFKINDVIIDEKIFMEELVDYKIVDIQQQIEDLCMWISESDRSSDKQLMLEDLKMLLNKADRVLDEFMLSSISTNEYIFEDGEEFNEICAGILELNEKLKKQ